MLMSAEEFVERVNRHIEESGESATTFGRRVANDPGLVFELRKGRVPSLRVCARVMRGIDDPGYRFSDERPAPAPAREEAA